MTTYIYTWSPRIFNDSTISGLLGQDVGHVALETDVTYLSYVPKDAVKKLNLNSYVYPGFKTYDQDIELRGSPKSENIVKLHNLDEEAIDRFYKKLKSEESRYNILKKNCSSVVVAAIREGYNSQRSKKDFMDEFSISQILSKNWFNILNGASNTLAGDKVYWEPKNVLAFAKAIKEISE